MSDNQVDYLNLAQIDLLLVERRAREMQAQAMAAGFRSLVRFIAARFSLRGTAAQTA